MRKTPGDIIILHKRTINDNHDVWFLTYEAQQIEFFAILGHFLPFYPTNNPKNYNFEKIKRTTQIYHHFTQVYQKS